MNRTNNNGKRVILTHEFYDDSTLVVPSTAELTVMLGLKTTAMSSHDDLIVVGGGPAGLTAVLLIRKYQILV